MSMVGVGCILVSAVVFSAAYIGSLDGAVRHRVRRDGHRQGRCCSWHCSGSGSAISSSSSGSGATPATSVVRLRRFAEVEIGVGLTLFFAAASLTTTPVAVDVRAGPGQRRRHRRAVLAALADHASPPDHSTLNMPPAVFVPGSGETYAHGLTDSQLSEFGHHRAGVFILVIAMMALAGPRPGAAGRGIGRSVSWRWACS